MAGWPEAGLEDLEEEEIENSDDEGDLEDADGLPGDEEQHPFPSDEYLALAESLTQLHVANFAPGRLAEAVAAAEAIFRGRSSRLRQSDLEAVRKLLRDGIGFGFDKVLRDANLHSTSSAAEEDALFTALKALVALAALLLEMRARAAGPQAANPQLRELDGELLQLVGVLGTLFTKDTALHDYHISAEAPVYDDDPAAGLHRFAVPPAPPPRLRGRGGSGRGGGSDEETEEEDEAEELAADGEHHWLIYLINFFGYSSGFHAIYHLINGFQEQQLSISMLAALIHVLARTAEFMPDADMLRPFQKAVSDVMKQLVPLAASDDDALSDQGQDRTYMTLRYLLSNASEVLCTRGGELAADAALAPVQQAFVVAMMGSSSFTKQLSGVRELRAALHRVAELPEGDGREVRIQDFVEWMEQQQLVERILRANLHQRQYMQQVNSILRDLTSLGALTNAHIEQLWGVTEQEGTHEGVKAHVYECLAELVGAFSAEQVDFLFGKMAAKRERSTLDTTKLLDLLLRLARTDEQCSLPDRVISLAWSIVMAPGAPPAVVDAGARHLADISGEYAQLSGKSNHLSQLSLRCLDELRARRNHVAALRTLDHAISRWNAEFKRIKRDKPVSIIDRFDDQHHVFNLLVGNIAAIASDARRCSPSSAAAAPTAAAAAAALPGEGPWSHADIVRTYLDTLHSLYFNSTMFMAPELADALWAELVAAPPCRADLSRAVAFFRSALGREPYLEDPEVAALLRRVPALPPGAITKEVFALTWVMFQQVNSKHLNELSYPTGSHTNRIAWLATTLQLQDLSTLWTLYETCASNAVAGVIRSRLLDLYHANVWDADDVMTRFRAAFIREVTARLGAAVEELDRQQQPGPAQDMALRRVSRHLDAAVECSLQCQEETMPPIPAHSQAWQGTPIMVDAHGQQQPRMRVPSHSNEYLGALRSKVARMMGGASPKRVRLFLAGHEYTNDAAIVGDLDLRGARQVVTVQLSQVDNSFTLLPAESWPLWERSSPDWLLSRQSQIFDLLFHIIDGPHGKQLAKQALQLLRAMPTSPAIAAQVHAGLERQSQQQQQQQRSAACSSPLEQALTGSADDSSGSSGGAVARPYQVLYRLEALAALLFPAVADTQASAPVGPAADADEPGPEANGGAQAAPAATAPPLDAAARRALQERFLAEGGLRVVCGLVEALVDARPGESQLLRGLGQLAVVLIHNLMDAATQRGAAPGAAAAAAAAAGPSGGQQPGAAAAATSASESAPGSASAMAVTATNGVEPGGPPCAAGDSVMADALEAAAAAAAAAGAPAALGSSSTATPVRVVDQSPAPMEASPPCPALPQGAATAAGPADPKAAAVEAALAQAGGRKAAGDAGVLSSDDKQHPPDQQQHQLEAAAGPALEASPGAGPLRTPAAAAAGPAARLPPPPLQLDAPTLGLIASTLPRIAAHAARLWGTQRAPPATPDDERGGNNSIADIGLVREALLLLQRALDLHPELLSQLLSPDGGGPALVSDLLLSPYYSAVRGAAEECLGRLCCSASEPLDWLLARLSEARPAAAGWPGAAGAFYGLFTRAVRALGAVERAPQGAYARAEALLQEEVAALRALPPAGGDADNIALQGRLCLLHALVSTLDRRCVGAGREAGLIQLLLSEYLFPEARLAREESAGRLSLAECAPRLRPRCAAPGARRAALELAAELMREGPGPLEEGVRVLEEMIDSACPPDFPTTAPKAVRRPGDYCGLRNAGATCYMNAVFQQLYMQPRIRALVLGAPEVPEAERADSVFAQLQGVFAAMALGLSPFATPEGFWRAFKDYDGQPIDTKEHQDAYEFFTRLQDCVDSHLQSVSCTPALSSVMGGRFAQQVICRGVPYRSEREEEFLQISVEVRHMGTLEKSLASYVQGELMEGDNAYHCEELGRKVPALKRACIKALPHTLVIHLKRFEFDYHSQTRFKVRDRFEFPLELDLFPYTADGLAAAEADAAAGGGNGGGGLARASSSSDGGGANGGPSPADGSAAAAAAAAGASAGGAPSPRGSYAYDLAGVVVHSGSAFTGHYYSFARDRAPAAGGGWFCFDDKSVKPWDTVYLETDCFGGYPSQDFGSRGWRPPRNEVERPHSAYMLFYERRCEAPEDARVLAEGEAGRCWQQPAAPAAAAAVQSDPAADAAVAVAAAQTAPPQPQQQQAGGSSGGGGGFVAPWGMPLSLYRAVMLGNISIMQKLHTLDREFFRFVRLLVENRSDVGGQLSNRKARRREALPPAPPPAAAAAAGSAGGSAAAAAMSCDAPSAAAAAGAVPPLAVPDASASGGSGAAAAAAFGGGAAAAEQLPSPGPSSRRAEDAEAVAVALTRLALRFQLQLYQRSVAALRTDAGMWAEMLKSLVNAGPAAAACQLAALQLLSAHPAWLQAALVQAPDANVRGFVGDMVGFLLVHAAARTNLPLMLSQLAAAAGAPAADGAAAGPPASASSPQQPQAPAPGPAQHLAAALLTLVNQLANLAAAAVAGAAGGADNAGYVGAAALALREYVAAAPPLHSALLLGQHPDLPHTMVEHIAALAAAGPEGAEDLREDGAPAARLLYALVARASNLEHLAAEFNASQAAGGYVSNPNGGLLNPFAAAVRGGGGGVPDPALQQRTFARLHDADVLRALTEPLLLMSTQDVPALLSLLSWENSAATQALAARLMAVLGALTVPAFLNIANVLVPIARDILGVRDTLCSIRLYFALFHPAPARGAAPCFVATLLEGHSHGWFAVRKMALVSALESALRNCGSAATQQVLSVGLNALRVSAAVIASELAGIEAEAAAMDSTEPLAPSYVRPLGAALPLLRAAFAAFPGAAEQLAAVAAAAAAAGGDFGGHGGGGGAPGPRGSVASGQPGGAAAVARHHQRPVLVAAQPHDGGGGSDDEAAVVEIAGGDEEEEDAGGDEGGAVP